ncbi:dihydrofolate reductase-like domain-containing protein [Gilbertella persicaria]|uniref:dihydrofolate reductase-like domain-containing protein n=1 Tax=Gilbertella persicaria TaxID=101096 RepID=UPI002221219C|nr:dihydrofolate reductase-like domain-containing protein [Gilbertella persicaria]KAI8075372.1 dihydrofolate reductase-like domain-containing protein [Gilbertella persicaria]
MTIKKPFVFMAAALAHNGGIGYKNGLPWSIPGDWEYFERVTTKSFDDNKHYEDYNNVIILGRYTFESRPMCSVPLLSRYNIVVSRNPTYKITSPIAALTTSLEEAFELASLKVKENGRIFLLGGEQIYRQSILMPECTHVLLTHIYSTKEIPCDAFIPKIDPNVFRLANHDELEAFIQENIPKGRQTYQHFEYEFVLYIRQ